MMSNGGNYGVYGQQNEAGWRQLGYLAVLHDRVASFEGLQVLGIGCGSLLQYLCKGGAHVTVADRSPERLQRAMHDFAAHHMCGRFVECSDLGELPFPADAFDLVVSVGVLGRDLDRALPEVTRIGNVNWHVVNEARTAPGFVRVTKSANLPADVVAWSWRKVEH